MGILTGLYRTVWGQIAPPGPGSRSGPQRGSVVLEGDLVVPANGNVGGDIPSDGGGTNEGCEGVNRPDSGYWNNPGC